MTLVDAGPLIALCDASDQEHERCVAALGSVVPPLRTTWPAVVEAMYLLGERAGWAGQKALWAALGPRRFQVVDFEPADSERMRALMEQYRDVPMDLGDASIVAVAERLGTLRVFTVDSDFVVYRTEKGKRFKLLPAIC